MEGLISLDLPLIQVPLLEALQQHAMIKIRQFSILQLTLKSFFLWSLYLFVIVYVHVYRSVHSSCNYDQQRLDDYNQQVTSVEI